MKKEIIIASGNQGKIREVAQILNEYAIIPMNEVGIALDVEEDKDTFKGNACKKAEEIAKASGGKFCIADDSGIEIETLDGFPGVFTKRWLKGTDRDRNLALIQKLKGSPKEKRKIKFITAIAISNGSKTICEEEIVEGYVAKEPRGENGFGFDEIFELENGRTLAEISQEEKNKIGARRKAIERVRDRIKEVKQD